MGMSFQWRGWVGTQEWNCWVVQKLHACDFQKMLKYFSKLFPHLILTFYLLPKEKKMFHHSVIHNTCIAFPRRMDNCLLNQKYRNETVTFFKILWSVWESDQQPGHTTLRGLWRLPTPRPEGKQQGACPRLVEIDCPSWLLETHIKGSGRGV